MMLNQMPAGRPEPRWTKYQPSSDVKDCEWRVEEMEILGVKQRYIMIRGTFATSADSVSIDMPAGVNVFYPNINQGFVIECYENNGNLNFGTTGAVVQNASSNSIRFNNIWYRGARFLIFTRVR